MFEKDGLLRFYHDEAEKVVTDAQTESLDYAEGLR